MILAFEHRSAKIKEMNFKRPWHYKNEDRARVSMRLLDSDPEEFKYGSVMADDPALAGYDEAYICISFDDGTWESVHFTRVEPLLAAE